MDNYIIEIDSSNVAEERRSRALKCCNVLDAYRNLTERAAATPPDRPAYVPWTPAMTARVMNCANVRKRVVKAGPNKELARKIGEACLGLGED